MKTDRAGSRVAASTHVRKEMRAPDFAKNEILGYGFSSIGMELEVKPLSGNARRRGFVHAYREGKVAYLELSSTDAAGWDERMRAKGKRREVEIRDVSSIASIATLLKSTAEAIAAEERPSFPPMFRKNTDVDTLKLFAANLEVAKKRAQPKLSPPDVGRGPLFDFADVRYVGRDNVWMSLDAQISIRLPLGPEERRVQINSGYNGDGCLRFEASLLREYGGGGEMGVPRRILDGVAVHGASLSGDDLRALDKALDGRLKNETWVGEAEVAIKELRIRIADWLAQEPAMLTLKGPRAP